MMVFKMYLLSNIFGVSMLVFGGVYQMVVSHSQFHVHTPESWGEDSEIILTNMSFKSMIEATDRIALDSSS